MDTCSFERPHHQRIASILHALDAKLLADNDCLFGDPPAFAIIGE